MSAPTCSAGSTSSGEAAPFLVASPTDHSPDIVLVTAIGVTLILLTFVIRVYIRFNFSGPWLADDTVFTLAMVRNPWAELLGIELVIRGNRPLLWRNHPWFVRQSIMDGEES
jgi:hypothetical protein